MRRYSTLQELLYRIASRAVLLSQLEALAHGSTRQELDFLKQQLIKRPIQRITKPLLRITVALEDRHKTARIPVWKTDTALLEGVEA